MEEDQDNIGMPRPCLELDDDQQNNTENGSDSINAYGDEGLSRSAVPTAELGHTNRTSLEPAPPGSRQLATSPLPQTIGKSNVKDTKPSGFGLHLNSLVNSEQNGAKLSTKSMESGSISIRSKSSSTIRFPSSESSRSCPLPEFESLKILEPIPCDKRKYSTTNSNINEEHSQSSPKKIRFEKLDVDDDSGFKRCNCKSTSCLKIFCNCYAAGISCSESCTCQGCFNRPEMKNTVEDTTQQIDSQNPLASAPKVIQPATEARTKKIMEDGILTSSARRRTRCNCKKSMCLKGNCMCFLAGVGCSGGCSCAGCQNKYGQKEECVNERHPSKQDIHEVYEVSSGGKLQEVASTDGTLRTQFSTHELTPQTPSFQNSKSINAFGDEGLSRSAASTAELGHINPTSLEPAPPASRQLPTSPLSQTIGKPNVNDTKPSGIGLHLNSLVNSVQNGATISMKSKQSGSVSIRSKSSSTARFLSSEGSRSCPLSEFESLKTVEPISCDKRKYSTTNSNINEELSQSSPKKLRFEKLDVDEDSGFKHCNCKSTSCLKIFCNCYAAGIYCSESCTCQGCFNRPEMEDTVDNTTQQIDSQNSLAFGPKIIQPATEASTKSMEDVILVHRIFCDCKKSMCLKGYCVCFQASVGCSGRCSCFGCQNKYGQKEEYVNERHLQKQDISELYEVPSGEKLQVASADGTLCTQQFSTHYLTSQTPSFQYSDHGKDRSESQVPSGRYLPSPESANVADSYLISPAPSGNSSSHGIDEDTNKDIFNLDPLIQELDAGNLFTADEFSPRYHGPSSINDIPSSLLCTKSPISAAMESFEEDILGAMDSDYGLREALEDDTPDILKDTVTSLDSGKVHSPNKKQVSPPHGTVVPSRKDILKSVPSFPPVTPSIVSKDENPGPPNKK